jgi:hypothetical protein
MNPTFYYEYGKREEYSLGGYVLLDYNSNDGGHNGNQLKLDTSRKIL